MELLLNLVWLTLALPAIWVWRHEPVRAGHSSGFSRIRASLLLICVLTLLFPVVSATDDLHPMRPEMEESSPFKRTVKQSSGTSTAAAWLTPCDSFFARSSPSPQISLGSETGLLVVPGSLVFRALLTSSPRDSRPPPSSLFG